MGIATPVCALVRNDLVIWQPVASIQQGDKLKLVFIAHLALPMGELAKIFDF